MIIHLSFALQIAAVLKKFLIEVRNDFVYNEGRRERADSEEPGTDIQEI